MEYEAVHVERRGGIGILTLNRPDRLNAMNQVLLREYMETLETNFRDALKKLEAKL